MTSHTVRLRNNATGEERVVPVEGDWDDESSEFLWTEGNCACDCNRGDDFFGDEPHDESCGDGRITALYAQLSDGRRIALDEPLPEEG